MHLFPPLGSVVAVPLYSPAAVLFHAREGEVVGDKNQLPIHVELWTSLPCTQVPSECEKWRSLPVPMLKGPHRKSPPEKALTASCDDDYIVAGSVFFPTLSGEYESTARLGRGDDPDHQYVGGSPGTGWQWLGGLGHNTRIHVLVPPSLHRLVPRPAGDGIPCPSILLLCELMASAARALGPLKVRAGGAGEGQTSDSHADNKSAADNNSLSAGWSSPGNFALSGSGSGSAGTGTGSETRLCSVGLARARLTALLDSGHSIMGPGGIGTGAGKASTAPLATPVSASTSAAAADEMSMLSREGAGASFVQGFAFGFSTPALHAPALSLSHEYAVPSSSSSSSSVVALGGAVEGGRGREWEWERAAQLGRGRGKGLATVNSPESAQGSGVMLRSTELRPASFVSGHTLLASAAHAGVHSTSTLAEDKTTRVTSGSGFGFRLFPASVTAAAACGPSPPPPPPPSLSLIPDAVELAYVASLLHVVIGATMANAPHSTQVPNKPSTISSEQLPGKNTSQLELNAFTERAAARSHFARALLDLLLIVPVLRTPAFRAKLLARLLGLETGAASSLLDDLGRMPIALVAKMDEGIRSMRRGQRAAAQAREEAALASGHGAGDFANCLSPARQGEGGGDGVEDGFSVSDRKGRRRSQSHEPPGSGTVTGTTHSPALRRAGESLPDKHDEDYELFFSPTQSLALAKASAAANPFSPSATVTCEYNGTIVPLPRTLSSRLARAGSGTFSTPNRLSLGSKGSGTSSAGNSLRNLLANALAIGGSVPASSPSPSGPSSPGKGSVGPSPDAEGGRMASHDEEGNVYPISSRRGRMDSRSCGVGVEAGHSASQLTSRRGSGGSGGGEERERKLSTHSDTDVSVASSDAEAGAFLATDLEGAAPHQRSHAYSFSFRRRRSASAVPLPSEGVDTRRGSNASDGALLGRPKSVLSLEAVLSRLALGSAQRTARRSSVTVIGEASEAQSAHSRDSSEGEEGNGAGAGHSRRSASRGWFNLSRRSRSSTDASVRVDGGEGGQSRTIVVLGYSANTDEAAAEAACSHAKPSLVDNRVGESMAVEDDGTHGEREGGASINTSSASAMSPPRVVSQRHRDRDRVASARGRVGGAGAGRGKGKGMYVMSNPTPVLTAHESAVLTLGKWASGGHWTPADGVAGGLQVLALELFTSLLQSCTPSLIHPTIILHVLHGLCTSTAGSLVRSHYARALRVLFGKGSPTLNSATLARPEAGAGAVFGSPLPVSIPIPNLAKSVIIGVHDILHAHLSDVAAAQARSRYAELPALGPTSAGHTLLSPPALPSASAAVVGGSFASAPSPIVKQQAGAVQGGGGGGTATPVAHTQASPSPSSGPGKLLSYASVGAGHGSLGAGVSALASPGPKGGAHSALAWGSTSGVGAGGGVDVLPVAGVGSPVSRGQAGGMQGWVRKGCPSAPHAAVTPPLSNRRGSAGGRGKEEASAASQATSVTAATLQAGLPDVRSPLAGAGAQGRAAASPIPIYRPVLPTPYKEEQGRAVSSVPVQRADSPAPAPFTSACGLALGYSTPDPWLLDCASRESGFELTVLMGFVADLLHESKAASAARSASKALVQGLAGVGAATLGVGGSGSAYPAARVSRSRSDSGNGTALRSSGTMRSDMASTGIEQESFAVESSGPTNGAAGLASSAPVPLQMRRVRKASRSLIGMPSGGGSGSGSDGEGGGGGGSVSPRPPPATAMSHAGASPMPSPGASPRMKMATCTDTGSTLALDGLTPLAPVPTQPHTVGLECKPSSLSCTDCGGSCAVQSSTLAASVTASEDTAVCSGHTGTGMSHASVGSPVTSTPPMPGSSASAWIGPTKDAARLATLCPSSNRGGPSLALWLEAARAVATAAVRLSAVPDGGDGISAEYRAVLTAAMQLCSSCPLLREAVLRRILRKWPSGNSDNEVALLEFLAAVLVSTASAADLAVSGIADLLLSRVLKCLRSLHIKVSRNALVLVDPARHLVDFLIESPARLGKLLAVLSDNAGGPSGPSPSPSSSSPGHWSPLVRRASALAYALYSGRLEALCLSRGEAPTAAIAAYVTPHTAAVKLSACARARALARQADADDLRVKGGLLATGAGCMPVIHPRSPAGRSLASAQPPPSPLWAGKGPSEVVAPVRSPVQAQLHVDSSLAENRLLERDSFDAIPSPSPKHSLSDALTSSSLRKMSGLDLTTDEQQS